MLKKVFAIFTAVLLIVCQITVASFAAEPVKLTLSGGEVYAGEEITVNLFIGDNSNLSGAAIKINYDNTRLKFISGEKGGIIDESANVAINDIDVNGNSVSYVIFTYMSPNAAITAEGILASLKFRALDSAVGAADLTISIDSPGDFVDGNLSKLSYTVQNSKVNVINNNIASTEQPASQETDVSIDAETSPVQEENSNASSKKIETGNDKKASGNIKIIVSIAVGAVFVGVGVAVIIIDKKRRDKK